MRCCHSLTQREMSMEWGTSVIFLAAGGVLPLARADVAKARRSASAWAPNLPPSSIANGTMTCCPPCTDAMGWLEVLPA